MEMERNFAVHYSTDIEHKSLYKWCLRQTHEDGAQVGRDLIPWDWSLKFEAVEAFHSISFSKERFGMDDGEEDDREDAATVDTREIIEAKLMPVERLSLPPRYFIFGYRDAVEMISLRVFRSKNDARCTAYSFAKYESEIDFHRELVPHHLGFDLLLSEEKFDKILQIMRMNTLNGFSFVVGMVDGFYSDWSPGITTDSIHILPRSSLEDLNLEEHEDYLPTIGKVGKFDIFVSRKIAVDHRNEEDNL